MTRTASTNDASPPTDTVVILPTYNEADNLRLLLPELLRLPISVCVVDDNSPDGSGAIAESWRADDPRVFVLHRPGKLGLGTAYLAGFHFALDHGFASVVTMDADFSHHPRYLPDLLAQAERYDLVIGSRYVPGGDVRYPFHRRWLSRLANRIARAALRRDGNAVLALDDGRIPYFGLCDAGRPEAVWGGANAAGFCIVNAVSRDLPGGSEQGPGNGGFIKLALQLPGFHSGLRDGPGIGVADRDADGLAVAAAEERFRGARGAIFGHSRNQAEIASLSAFTRSVFSQEKEPSRPALRPK